MGVLPGVCARISVSGGRPSPHIRRVASRNPSCGRLVESSAHGQFIPFLFAVDVRYENPRSRAAFGARVEEVKKKKNAKAPRRASSRVVGRGAIRQTTGCSPSVLRG